MLNYRLPLSSKKKKMALAGRTLLAYLVQEREIGVEWIWLLYLCNVGKTNEKESPDESAYGRVITLSIYSSWNFFPPREANE